MGLDSSYSCSSLETEYECSCSGCECGDGGCQFSNFRGDGYCDDGNNNDGCDWDGGGKIH